MGYILVAVAASLAFGPAPGRPVSHPLAQRHFADEASCKQAAGVLPSAPGTKLFCVTVDNSPVLQAAN